MSPFDKLHAIEENNRRVDALYKKGSLSYSAALTAIQVGYRDSKNHWTILRPQVEERNQAFRIKARVDPVGKPSQGMRAFLSQHFTGAMSDGSIFL